METPEQPVRLINWELAATTAATLATPGPKLAPGEIDAVVADLRAHAEASVEHVHRITGLDAAENLRDSTVLVVDRPTWARANTQSFEALMDPVLRRLAEKRQPGELAAALGGTATGLEMGAILAFLSSKVLGQYDPFAGLLRPGAGSGGRLMFVAPNVVEIERELNVEPSDFRLWVCLHEQTHRVQFAAAPWLGDHLRDQIGSLADGLFEKADGLGERLKAAAKAALAARATGASPAGSTTPETDDVPEPGMGLLSLLQDPKDKETMSRLTAVMSLLEGHANVVMDAVDASVVPSVKTIRQRFDRRDADRGAIEKFLRRFLGLDAKMRQYADGQKFVRRAVDVLGMEGFNVVWDHAGNLPTERELHHPDEWVARMREGSARPSAG